MFVQKVVDVRQGVPTTTTLYGPFHSDVRVTVASPNKTQVSVVASGDKAAWRLGNHFGNLMPMNTRLAYAYRTDQGVSPVLGQTNLIQFDRADADIQANEPGTAKKDAKKPTRPRWAVKGKALFWRPKNAPPGAREWIPYFLGSDGQWYTLPNKDGGEGWPLNTPASIVSNDPQAPHSWDYGRLPQSAQDSPNSGNPDASGIDAPTSALDPPDVTGPVSCPPGNYGFRTTFSVDDEESAPSDGTVVTLRDAGLAAGGAATGTTDQIAYVLRPSVQKIANARYVSKDASGELDLDWTTPSLPGVTVTTGDGVLVVDDTSNATTADAVKLSDPFPINPLRYYTLRMKLNMTRYGGGTFDVVVQFLNSSNAIIGNSPVIERISSLDSFAMERTLGPSSTPAQVNVPATATQMQIIFRGVGTTTPRNFRVGVSHIGMVYGRAHHRKRWPLNLGLGARGSEKRRTPTEDETLPYPNGAYCHVVENPDDGARFINPTDLLFEGFESGANPPAGWTRVLSGSTTLSANVSGGVAISGDYGARVGDNAGGTGLSQAYWRNASFLGRTSLGASVYTHEVTLPSANASVVRITRDGTDANNLAEVRVTSGGLINLLTRNGTSDVVTTAYVGVLSGYSIRYELVCLGAGTANGRAILNLWINGRRMPSTTVQSLNWTGLQVGNLLVGGIDVAAGCVLLRYLDRIRVTADGVNDTDPIPGNYAEYWAGEGQPYLQDAFVKSGAVPVDPDTDYTFSAYLGVQGVQRAASLFRTVFRDTKGQVVKNNGYLTTNMKGHIPWDRYSLTLHSPPNAAYFEIAGSLVGDGLIRAMGIQLEGGNTLTQFTNTNAAAGYATVRMDTKTPGTEDFSDALSWIDEWIASRIIANQEEDANGNPLTATTLQLRASDTYPVPSSTPWQPDLASLLSAGAGRYVELRANLSTTNLTLSPELRGMFLELEREESILLKQDGSEFYGGAQALNFPVPVPGDTLVYTTYADGSVGKEDYYRGRPPDTASGWTIQCFRKQAVDDIMRRRAAGESFQVEAWGQRYHLDIVSAPKFPINAKEHSEAEDDSDDGFWLFSATVDSANVIRQVDI